MDMVGAVWRELTHSVPFPLNGRQMQPLATLRLMLVHLEYIEEKMSQLLLFSLFSHLTHFSPAQATAKARREQRLNSGVSLGWRLRRSKHSFPLRVFSAGFCLSIGGVGRVVGIRRLGFYIFYI
jgi:hypothetical protein